MRRQGRFQQVCNWGGQEQNFSMYCLKILKFLSSQLISMLNTSETQNLRTMSQNYMKSPYLCNASQNSQRDNVGIKIALKPDFKKITDSSYVWLNMDDF